MAPAQFALAALLAGLLLAAAAAQEPPCALNAHELRALLESPVWRETTMTDGKPLVLSISEREGRAFIRFVKAGEGLWAEGHAEICAAGDGVQARLREHELVLGRAANWLIRRVLRQGGARFDLARLPDGRLRVATTGWTGDFTAHAP